MGFLSLFAKSGAGVQRLPQGSMTVDRCGSIVTTTISSTYPPELLNLVAGEVLRLFQEAQGAELTLSELNIHFASLQITAREMRGGAIVFFSPKTQFTTSSAN